MAGVFISYRRDDCAGHAGRLYDGLADNVGRDSVFMDVDAIEPGIDFGERIAEAIGACKVVIVLIGDDWLDIADAAGRRRLDDPADLVRLEVAAALQRTDVRLIPVLVEEAKMPPAELLPDDLKALARRNALQLSDAGWRRDVQRLIEVVERVVCAADESSSVPSRATPSTTAVSATSSQDENRRAPSGYEGPGVRARHGSPRASVARSPRALAGAAAVLVAAILAAVILSGGGDDDTTAASPPTTATIPRPTGTQPDAAISLATRPNAITFANAGVWVLSARSPDIALLDAKTSRLTRPIPIGLGGTAVTAGLGHVWVLKGNTGSLIRLSRTGGRAGATKIAAPGMPVAVVAGAGAVWVGVRNGLKGTLVRVDPNAPSEQRPVDIPGGLQDIAVGRGAVWVTTISRDSVVRVDAKDMTKLKEIAVGKRPRGVAVGEGAVWVANSESDSITPIDPATRTAGNPIALEFNPNRVAIGGGSVWATAQEANRLIRIDPRRREVRELIETGRQPYALKVVRGQDVWITLLNGNGVQRVRFER